MKTLIKTACLTLALAAVFATLQDAQAGHGHFQSGGNYSNGYSNNYSGGFGNNYGQFSNGYSRSNFGYSRPIYHAPSVHLDRVYHPTSTHWTPSQGLHTHGHYDTVPHYTPGHFDTLHNGHVDYNSRYHN
jgi:hypothetical protein